MEGILILAIIIAVVNIRSRYKKVMAQRPGAHPAANKAPLPSGPFPFSVPAPAPAPDRAPAVPAPHWAAPIDADWAAHGSLEGYSVPSPSLDQTIQGVSYEPVSASYAEAHVTPRGSENTGRSAPARALLSLDASDMRRAVILSEILTRPTERRRRWQRI